MRKGKPGVGDPLFILQKVTKATKRLPPVVLFRAFRSCVPSLASFASVKGLFFQLSNSVFEFLDASLG
jgi:hypothetical protein